jgi:hypothetical protein
MHRTTLLAAVLAGAALAACQPAEETASTEPAADHTEHTMPATPGADGAAPQQAAPAMDPQWATLFDGTSVDNFTPVGNANWMIVDNYVEATSGVGFLVTRGGYGDFHLRADFWTSPEANSGIFIRCQNPAEIAAATCYEVNVFDQRPDPQYRTGAIVDVAPPMAQIDAGNKWNTYEITAEGNRLLVRLNGTVTVDVEDSKFRSGVIALQYGAGAGAETGTGTVRFRNVQIMPL